MVVVVVSVVVMLVVLVVVLVGVLVVVLEVLVVVLVVALVVWAKVKVLNRGKRFCLDLPPPPYLVRVWHPKCPSRWRAKWPSQGQSRSSSWSALRLMVDLRRVWRALICQKGCDSGWCRPNLR